MEQFSAIKQMVQFNKNAFDQGYNAMDMLRKQNEKMTNSFLDQAEWLPEEGKKAVNEWMQFCKKGCDDFKKTADQNFKNVEKLFSAYSK
jgi:polyhydroxyalkanoate synthesis regulator phasin